LLSLDVIVWWFGFRSRCSLLSLALSLASPNDAMINDIDFARDESGVNFDTFFSHDGVWGELKLILDENLCKLVRFYF
jgi:hypothetical protein